MKIVLPYSAHKGFDVNSNKMVGGIEKFIKEVADNFDVICTCDRRRQKSKQDKTDS